MSFCCPQCKEEERIYSSQVGEYPWEHVCDVCGYEWTEVIE